MKNDDFRRMFTQFFNLLLRGLDSKRPLKIKKMIKKNGKQNAFNYIREELYDEKEQRMIYWLPLSREEKLEMLMN